MNFLFAFCLLFYDYSFGLSSSRFSMLKGIIVIGLFVTT